jgi:hypothetical protein
MTGGVKFFQKLKGLYVGKDVGKAITPVGVK